MSQQPSCVLFTEIANHKNVYRIVRWFLVVFDTVNRLFNEMQRKILSLCIACDYLRTIVFCLDLFCINYNNICKELSREICVIRSSYDRTYTF